MFYVQGTVVSTREGCEHTAMLDKPENGHLEEGAGACLTLVFSKHLRSEKTEEVPRTQRARHSLELAVALLWSAGSALASVRMCVSR